MQTMKVQSKSVTRTDQWRRLGQLERYKQISILIDKQDESESVSKYQFQIFIRNPRMQPQSSNKLQSNINISFGHTPQGQSLPVNFILAIDLNSSKLQNKRFNAGEYLKIEIPQNCVLFEIQAAGESEDLAQQLKQIQQHSPSIASIKEQTEFKTQIIGKGSKVYVVLEAEDISSKIKQFNEKTVSDFMIDCPEERFLEINVKSRNKLRRIHEITQNKGVVQAILDSLSLSIKFNKTQTISNVVTTVLTPFLGVEKAELFTKLFEQVNFDLRFDSAAELQHFPQLTQSLRQVWANDQFSHQFKAVKEKLGNKIQFYVFGKPFSCSGSLSSDEMFLILDLLFA